MEKGSVCVTGEGYYVNTTIRSSNAERDTTYLIAGEGPLTNECNLQTQVAAMIKSFTGWFSS
ncbi:hypothetical protein HanPI659440_Chr04g0176801 [Helianthus annuus]|nr:hypothetical protein HanPI659440_Chr04g0176801 [Helianthus annuus]